MEIQSSTRPSVEPATRLGLEALVIAAVAAFPLITRHGIHFVGLFAYALLIASPFIYLFIRGSRGQPSAEAGSPAPPT